MSPYHKAGMVPVAAFLVVLSARKEAGVWCGPCLGGMGLHLGLFVCGEVGPHSTVLQGFFWQCSEVHMYDQCFGNGLHLGY